MQQLINLAKNRALLLLIILFCFGTFSIIFADSLITAKTNLIFCERQGYGTSYSSVNDINPNNILLKMNGLYDIKSVSLGRFHTLALKSNGTVWSWGDNDLSELGNGNTKSSKVPVQVDNLSDITSISAGRHGISSALKSDGSVWAWGSSRYTDYGEMAPFQVRGLSNIVQTSCGRNQCLALKSDGTVWTWNLNRSDKPMALQAIGFDNIISISAGESHGIALKSDGTVWAWGDNTFGQLGDGTFKINNIPAQVGGLKEVISVNAGDLHNVVLKSDGSLWTWGFNGHGELGDGTRNNSNMPLMVSGLFNVAKVVAGGSHNLAISANGDVYSWGLNSHGQLGISNTNDSYKPVQISALSGIIGIGGGIYNSLASDSNGETWGWGYNKFGQLGDNTTSNKHLPFSVSKPTAQPISLTIIILIILAFLAGAMIIILIIRKNRNEKNQPQKNYYSETFERESIDNLKAHWGEKAKPRKLRLFWVLLVVFVLLAIEMLGAIGAQMTYHVPLNPSVVEEDLISWPNIISEYLKPKIAPQIFDPYADEIYLDYSNSILMTFEEYDRLGQYMYDPATKTINVPLSVNFVDGQPSMLRIRKAESRFGTYPLLLIDGFQHGDTLLSPFDGAMRFASVPQGNSPIFANYEQFKIDTSDALNNKISLTFASNILPAPNMKNMSIEKGQIIGMLNESNYYSVSPLSDQNIYGKYYLEILVEIKSGIKNFDSVNIATINGKAIIVTTDNNKRTMH
jgi:alpha-tubulin suppressor-like RCC1 family protein